MNIQFNNNDFSIEYREVESATYGTKDNYSIVAVSHGKYTDYRICVPGRAGMTIPGSLMWKDDKTSKPTPATVDWRAILASRYSKQPTTAPNPYEGKVLKVVVMTDLPTIEQEKWDAAFNKFMTTRDGDKPHFLIYLWNQPYIDWEVLEARRVDFLREFLRDCGLDPLSEVDGRPVEKHVYINYIFE